MKICFKLFPAFLLGIFSLLTGCSAPSSSTSEQPTIKMVLDIDTGIDDAMALAYALGCPNVELLGVMGSFGNVTMEQGLGNTLNLLSFFGRSDVPVYRGVDRPTHGTMPYQPDELVKVIHGMNGIGNITVPKATREVEKEDAVSFLLRMADKYKEQLTVVAVGPLTNLATAMERDKTFEEKVGKIVIMGGALTVPGNVNQLAEANIHNDPIAARRVLKSKAPVTMVGLDVTHRTLLTKDDTHQWLALDNPVASAMTQMADYCIDVSLKLEPAIKGCPLHDPLAVGVAVNSELVTTLPMYMEVGTQKEDWGRTIGDKSQLLEANPNVKVAIQVDHETFKQRFVERLYNLFKK